MKKCQNVNAIMLIRKESKHLKYEYFNHDSKEEFVENIFDFGEPLMIDPEYETGFPENEGLYKVNVTLEYDDEIGTTTTMNSCELIHDLNL